MRTRIQILFKSDPELASKILYPLHLQTDYSMDLQSIELFSDDPSLDELRNILKDQQIDFSEFKEIYFDENEKASAKFLELVPNGYWGYPQPEDEFEYLRESYDVSTGCPICGNGKKQIKPLLIKGRPKLGRNDILAIHWEYEFIITERLKKLIVDAGLTGVEFWPLLDHKKRTPIVGFFQLYIKSVLPPMSPNTEFETDDLGPNPKFKIPCKCSKLGRNLRLHQMRYKSQNLLDARDFNKTFEWLGGTYHTTQWAVVSSRVFRFFRENNIHKVDFRPIVIED